MEVRLTGELEVKVMHSAARQGRNPDDLVQEVLTRYFEEEAAPGPTPELPILHLGAIGPLHRRDIYNDVR